VLNDLRAAWRSLARSPGFVVVAVLALGLGLGLSTSMFGVIDAVLHPVPAYGNADRLCFIKSYGFGSRMGAPPPPSDIFGLVDSLSHSFDAMVPYKGDLAPIEAREEAREFLVVTVPLQWFDVVGVRFTLGRPFTPADGDGVAVVSYDIWRFVSGGRRTLTGTHVRMGGRSYAVVGVMARGPSEYAAVMPMLPGAELTGHVGHVFRLKRGVTIQQAAADLKSVAAMLTARYSGPGQEWYFHLAPLREAREEVRDIHVAMVGSALAVLLIACVNLAHLMLARGLAKRRELAVRMALGAGRGVVTRIMFAEGAVIAAGGVALGAVVAVWGSSFLQNLMPPEISWAGSIRFQLSWRVFAIGAGAAAGSGVLFGLLPALRVAFSIDLMQPLKADVGTTTGRDRWRYNPLVIAEVAMALALVMGGGLLLRSVHQLRTASMGFEPETLVTAKVLGNIGIRMRAGHPDTTSVDWPQALSLARAVPGVLAAAIEGKARPLGGAVIAEMGADPSRALTTQEYPVVSPEYLRVYGLPILKGRDFSAGDAMGAGAAILSSVAAGRLYPRGNAVGRMIKLGSPSSTAPWVPIVGIARTPIVPWDLDAPAGGYPLVWVVGPPAMWQSANLLVRAASRSPRIVVGLRRALRTLPAVYSVSVEPYTWIRDKEIASRTFLAKVFAGLGTAGLALAAMGLYGVLTYAVTRRMREFAVRIALGAEAPVLFRMVMHDGLVMLLAGTGIGAFLALASAYLFNAILIGVYPTDAISLVAAEAALLAVGLAATLAPARRAVRANPLDILRAV